MKTYFSLKKITKPEKEDVPLTARELLLADIAKTQHTLEVAYCGFDNVTDPDLIDCYIYEINSLLKRYKHLNELAAHEPSATLIMTAPIRNLLPGE